MGWTTKIRFPGGSGIFTFTTTSGSFLVRNQLPTQCVRTLLSWEIKRLECDDQNSLPSKPRSVMRLRLFPHAACRRVNNSAERLLCPYVSRFIRHERGYELWQYIPTEICCCRALESFLCCGWYCSLVICRQKITHR